MEKGRHDHAGIGATIDPVRFWQAGESVGVRRSLVHPAAGFDNPVAEQVLGNRYAIVPGNIAGRIAGAQMDDAGR